MIIFKEYIKFINKIEKIFSSVNTDFNIILELCFHEIEEKGNGSFKNINCEYKIKTIDLKIGKKQIFQDKDILNNDQYNKNTNNFISLLNDFYFKKPELSASSIEKNSSNSNESYYLSESKLKIDYFITKIGNHENTANYIKELSNGIIASFGPKDLIFYDYHNFINKRIGINNHYIFELKEYPNKLFIFSDKSVTINLKDFSMQIYDRFINCRICFAFNNYLFTYLEKRTYLEKILWPELSVPIGIHILNKLYWTGINLNNQIIALTSNKILSNGEDIIIFFNMNIRKIDFFIK